MQKIFTVDIHTHILPKDIPNFNKKFGYGEFIQLQHHKPCCAKMMMNDDFFREIESNCWDPKTRISECKKQNVDLQVLSTVPVMFSYWTKPKDGLEISQFLNDDLINTASYNPKKFVAIGNIPMQDTQLAIQELERCKNIGMPGIQIGSHINNLNLDDDSFFPIYEACQDLDMAIFVHPWWWMAKEKMEKYWLPWLVGMPMETSLAICSLIFSGVFQKLPNLRVAFAHGGGAFPATIGRIEHGFNVRPDLCAVDNNINPKEYLGQFWLDSLVHDDKILEYIVELVGEDKVALGTDYPFPLGELEPGRLIRSMPYPNTVKEKLLSTNALNWLGMQKSDFS
ncbi:MAG: amidohydrolase family protein [Bacteroidota bacterium]|nr:amidohydrolase family protein [Bacteroidota bacterium]